MQSEKVNWPAVILCAGLLIVGLIGGFFAGRANQGKVYRSAVVTAQKMEVLVGELSHSLAGARENYLRAEDEANRLAENYREASALIDELTEQNQRILRDNYALVDELGRLELEINTIRGDVSEVADDIGAVIEGAKAAEK